MSRFQSSSYTGSVPGATSSNSVSNASALSGRGYQVPHTSSILPTQLRPFRVVRACGPQTESSMKPSTLHPPSNEPGASSSSTLFGPTSPKKSKKIENQKTQKNTSLLSATLIPSASISSSSSYCSDSGSVTYESIDWSALKLPPIPHFNFNNLANRYRSPTMYSDSTTEWINSSQGSGSSELFPIHSPCIRIDRLSGPSTTFIINNLPEDPFGPSTTVFSPVIPAPSPARSSLPDFKFKLNFPSPGSTPTTQQSFSAHHTLSSASGPPSELSMHIPSFHSFSRSSSVSAQDGTHSLSTGSPSTQRSFSVHHTLSSASASPSVASMHIPTPHSFSRSSSVCAEVSTSIHLPRPPVVLFRRAKPISFREKWLQLTHQEAVLLARATIVTPERSFNERSSMFSSESDGEYVAPSPLEDPFICSPIPFKYSPSPSPSPSPIPQPPRRRQYGKFTDTRLPTGFLPRYPISIPLMTPAVIQDTPSTDDNSDTTDYPSSLDDYPEAPSEPETQSWIERHSKTIKTVATCGLIAAALILPKLFWKWAASKIHVLVVLAGDPQVREANGSNPLVFFNCFYEPQHDLLAPGAGSYEFLMERWSAIFRGTDIRDESES